ncbi:MAG: hypothetical protein DRQ65_01445 [Gammaproteobacteria bacterium]|nr:MAG: hypothetical protein DRQ98_01055 [Gammaproteobacteria bacterium]RLA57460.1 MAG: hypothetical protein DRQ65_01445 [Gammaproteobacteria bacterium]HDY82396.1 hypothetical protein [Halieaceae bacterium]
MKVRKSKYTDLPRRVRVHRTVTGINRHNVMHPFEAQATQQQIDTLLVDNPWIFSVGKFSDLAFE